MATLAGGGGAGGTARGYADLTGVAALFNNPTCIALYDGATSIFVTDTNNNLIRVVALATGEVTTLAGGHGGTVRGAADDYGTAASFFTPYGVACTALCATLFVADTGNALVRAIDVATAAVTTLAGGSSPGGSSGGSSGGWGPYDDNFYGGPSSSGGGARRLAGSVFSFPYGIASDATGTTVYVSDRGNVVVFTITVSTGAVDTLVGGGVFNDPAGLALDASGSTLYVADAGLHQVLAVDVQSSRVTTLAGSGNPGYADGSSDIAQFDNDVGIAVSTDGGYVYVADFTSSNVRAICLAQPPLAHRALPQSRQVPVRRPARRRQAQKRHQQTA